MITVFLNTVFFAGVALALAAAAQLYDHLRHWAAVDRIVAASIPIGAMFVAAIGLREILEGPFHMWESVRLLPSYIIANGLPHYYPLDHGPVLDMMYGPVTAFAYYPVTFFAHRATTATMVAKLFTYTYFFLPAAWLLHQKNEPRRNAAFAVLCFLAFALYSHETDVLSGSGYANHADAPALGLGAAACALLLKRRSSDDWLMIMASAGCAVLSVWTKQVMIPLVIAIPMYYALIGDGRTSRRFLAGLLLCGTLAAVVFGNLFGFNRLWANLVINPCRQPWEGTWVKLQGRAIVELMDECRWIGLLVILYAVYTLRLWRQPWEKFRAWIAQRPWGFLLFVGLCMVPTAIIGRVKAGGGLNALSFSMYYLVIAAGLIVREVAASDEVAVLDRTARNLAKVGVIFSLWSSVVLHALTLSYFYLHLAQNIRALDTNPLRAGYRFMKHHPQEVYLPWNCLTSFLAEGRLYHFDYALLDREIGGAPVTPEHFREGVPDHLRWIAFPPTAQDEFARQFLPEFSRRIDLPELPGWTVYIRPDDEDAASPLAMTPSRRPLDDLL